MDRLTQTSGATGKSVGTESGQRVAVRQVPARPALASSVQLIGKMKGTGFVEQQWLLQREGRFIQVTELLYRVAEQANGQRTLQEIAAGVTAATEWSVDPEDVKQLLKTTLIPLRLIRAEDDPLTNNSRLPAESLARSPLAVKMRLRVLSPRLIDPIARVLELLYVPPVFTPVIVAAVVLHGWLYFVRGPEVSLSAALHAPGGLLLIVGLVILGGMFHEFGHASALRYGGGRVRGMGVGLYLIYPVFYTDVTDSYRLDRWARLRTDLGGIYFHLIFASGLIAASMLAGAVLPLLAAVLMNVEIVRQFFPFARLDGYWILADLTGIPDLFSQMGPFLRKISRLRGAGGSELPNLKPWVKVAFAAYIVVTVPLLACVFVLMVRALPDILATTLSSLQEQQVMFAVAYAQTDVVTMILVAMSMLVIVLTVLGTVYIIGFGSQMALRVLWAGARAVRHGISRPVGPGSHARWSLVTPSGRAAQDASVPRR